MKRKSIFNTRGEVVTLLAIGALIVLGVTTLVSTAFLPKKNTSKTKAEISWICAGDGIAADDSVKATFIGVYKTEDAASSQWLAQHAKAKGQPASWCGGGVPAPTTASTEGQTSAKCDDMSWYCAGECASQDVRQTIGNADAWRAAKLDNCKKGVQSCTSKTSCENDTASTTTKGSTVTGCFHLEMGVEQTLPWNTTKYSTGKDFLLSAKFVSDGGDGDIKLFRDGALVGGPNGWNLLRDGRTYTYPPQYTNKGFENDRIHLNPGEAKTLNFQGWVNNSAACPQAISNLTCNLSVDKEGYPSSSCGFSNPPSPKPPTSTPTKPTTGGATTRPGAATPTFTPTPTLALVNCTLAITAKNSHYFLFNDDKLYSIDANETQNLCVSKADCQALTSSCVTPLYNMKDNSAFKSGRNIRLIEPQDLSCSASAATTSCSALKSYDYTTTKFFNTLYNLPEKTAGTCNLNYQLKDSKTKQPIAGASIKVFEIPDKGDKKLLYDDVTNSSGTFTKNSLPLVSFKTITIMADVKGYQGQQANYSLTSKADCSIDQFLSPDITQNGNGTDCTSNNSCPTVTPQATAAPQVNTKSNFVFTGRVLNMAKIISYATYWEMDIRIDKTTGPVRLTKSHPIFTQAGDSTSEVYKYEVDIDPADAKNLTKDSTCYLSLKFRGFGNGPIAATDEFKCLSETELNFNLPIKQSTLTFNPVECLWWGWGCDLLHIAENAKDGTNRKLRLHAGPSFSMYGYFSKSVTINKIADKKYEITVTYDAIDYDPHDTSNDIYYLEDDMGHTLQIK